MFFTVGLKDRSSDLLVREIDSLRTIVRQTLRIQPFQIDAWVVLPDHMHCVWTMPAKRTDYLHRWQMIRARFSNTVALHARDFSSAYRNGIFQDGLGEHVITDQDDWKRLVRYCWDDPVKHGLVRHPADWPYSSFRRDTARASDRVAKIAS